MAYGASAQNVYKKNQVENSSPKQLVVLLYEGAIKQIRLAELAAEKKDREKQNKHLLKAQDIINELNVSLNHEQGKEVADQLSSIYEYLLSELLQANLKSDINKMSHSRHMLSELLEAWNQI